MSSLTPVPRFAFNGNKAWLQHGHPKSKLHAKPIKPLTIPSLLIPASQQIPVEMRGQPIPLSLKSKTSCISPTVLIPEKASPRDAQKNGWPLWKRALAVMSAAIAAGILLKLAVNPSAFYQSSLDPSEVSLLIDCPSTPHGYSSGMFASFTYVLAGMDFAKQNKYGGVQVNFGKNGHYYEESKGDNWFSYYHNQILFENKKDLTVKKINQNDAYSKLATIECHKSRIEVNKLINESFKLNEDIQKEVDTFVLQNFEGHHVISIHYRGTDKMTAQGDWKVAEAHRVQYDEMIAKIKKYIADNKLMKFKIFVASDEQAFIDKMNAKFPQKVITTNARRSTNGKPLHFNIDNPYETGKDALIDSHLLSRGNVLFRTTSTLSLWSSFLNPHIPVFELGGRNPAHYSCPPPPKTSK